MIFTKDLLLKGLAGLALCTGTAALGVHYMGGFSSLYGSSEVKITRVEDIGLTTSETCKLPEAGAAVTCNLTAENIKSIKFDGKNDTTPTLTGSVAPLATLQISIPQDGEKADFPHGYKFRLSVPSANTDGVLTINRVATAGENIVIKAGKSADFKVKKTDSGFALEEAFTLNTIINKLADFTCADDGTCQIGTTTSISIKQGDRKESKTSTSNQPGKIKVYSGEEGYNKGFKFVIEDGDIALSSGGNISKLEELETYEIKKEGEEWILFRKTKSSEEVKTALNLPTSDCTMPENTSTTECTSLDVTKLSAIKFEGKGEADVTINDNNSPIIKLKISKTTDTNKADFPHGYKFVLESNKDISIPQVSGTEMTIKKETNTEFKIKKTGEGQSAVLTLEKAWTVGELAKKVKLTGCTEDTKECNFGASISVYENDTNKVVDATITTDKKITYVLDKENYNQGIKFYIPNSSENITISGGTTTSGVTAVTTISKETTAGTGNPSYEIKEVDGVWYLAKKS